MHSREKATLEPVTDVTLDRDGAQWPPRLSASERARVMRPEALHGNERRLLSVPMDGMHRRHLLVSARMLSISSHLNSLPQHVGHVLRQRFLLHLHPSVLCILRCKDSPSLCIT